MIDPNITGITKVDDANIFYQVFGEGKYNVILLHGNGEDWHCFDKQIYPFSRHFRVITIDSRGHGSSTLGNKGLSLEIMAEDVIAVMNDLKIDKGIILGFSDGGNIAMHMALRHPERIEKMILAGANIYPAGLRLWVRITIITEYIYYKLLSLFNEQAKYKMSILNLDISQPNFSIGDLNRIRVPTLVVAGEKDMIKHDHTVLISNAIQYSKLYIVPEANHFIFDKWAENVNKILIEYIRN